MTPARIFGFLLGLALVGCQNAVDHADTDRFAFQIRILEELTDEPVAGASVIAWGPYDTIVATLEPERREGLGSRFVTDADGRAVVEVSLMPEWPQPPSEDGSPSAPRWKVEYSISVSRVGFETASVTIADRLASMFITRETALPEIIVKLKKTAQPGATDNPDDAQRLREDH